MEYKMGDLIQLTNEKEYFVISSCIMNGMEYYLVMDREDIEKTLIVGIVKESKDVLVIKETEKIEKILKEMLK